jgi:aspartyl-tRNA(Asn)/glutamyl-tRNA(Gln) amidotransferase subunit A
VSDLLHHTAADTAALVAKGEVSAVEVTQAHLDRIAAVDERVHAFLHVDADGALAAARAVDEQRAGGDDPRSARRRAARRSRTSSPPAASPPPAGRRSSRAGARRTTPTVTRRLREAGVVVLGKTNMDEFAMGSSTENSAYGPTHNPWDLSRIPGGSGGGSSAAISSFMAALAIGTDTGGSIRQPASVTGPSA